MKNAFALLPWLLAACAAGPGAADRPPLHPLDPLTRREIEDAVRILREAGRLRDGLLLPSLTLREPGKDELRDFTPGRPFGRRANAVVFDRDQGRLSEAVVDLSARRVESWRDVPGAQPHLMPGEFQLVESIVLADPAWRAALAKRQLEPGDVEIDAWAAGDLPAAGLAPSARRARALAFHKGTGRNSYARPVEGLVAVVDLTAKRVASVEDSGPRPVPPLRVEDEAIAGGGGPSTPAIARTFEVEGHEIRWRRWALRYALDPREGLVIHTVSFDDRGRRRSILHRGSLCEMAVPYGDPGQAWAWRCAFDVGEYGLGRLSTPFTPGQDAPPGALLLDEVLASERGVAETAERSVAVYERDAGLLWKRESAGRRGRQLVVSSMAAVGNYDYVLEWIFHEDGTIEAQVGATGILLGKGTATGICAGCVDLAQGRNPDPASLGDERSGTRVAPFVVAPSHQHFFSWRLDLDVDGPANSVAEVDLRVMPSDGSNPHGNGIETGYWLIQNEVDSRRMVAPALQRTWKVFNPASRNALGHLAGYMLVPGETGVPFLRGETATRRRAGFTEFPIWVTRQHAGERYAAGDYPNQAAAPDGLPRWVEDDEKLVNTDVVIWHTTALTHLARPEEWPVMNVTRVGFRLVPMGFFDRNPATDPP